MKTSERVVFAIDKLTKENGYAPTMREIAEEVGLKSPSTVYGHMKKLREEGRISFEPKQVRTARVAP
ncbi:MAG: helix-turn-helix domain-containing protein [Sporolactobacillus sp.]